MLAVAVNIVSNLIAVAWLGLGLQGAAATTVATQVNRPAFIHTHWGRSVGCCYCLEEVKSAAVKHAAAR
jgi:hypothetical protein